MGREVSSGFIIIYKAKNWEESFCNWGIWKSTSEDSFEETARILHSYTLIVMKTTGAQYYPHECLKDTLDQCVT